MVISLLHFEYLYKSIPQTNIERVCIWPLIYIILLKNQWLNAPNYSSAGFNVIFVSILMHTNFNSWHNFSVASDFNMISLWFCGSFWWRDCSVCGLVLCSKVDVAESAKSLIDNKDLGTLQWNILNKRISRWSSLRLDNGTLHVSFCRRVFESSLWPLSYFAPQAECSLF